jgi:hypothetical protein
VKLLKPSLNQNEQSVKDFLDCRDLLFDSVKIKSLDWDTRQIVTHKNSVNSVSYHKIATTVYKYEKSFFLN